MDYKELIAEIRESNIDCAASIEKWATAIELLLAERDAAIEDLKCGKSRCNSCAYNYHSTYDYPCRHCKETGGMSDYWQWRGPRKEGGSP